MHLTLEQYQLLVPSDISDGATPRWPAHVSTGVDGLCNMLPLSMQPIIRSLDFTGKPELEAYYNTYLKPWLAWQINQDIILYANNATPEANMYPMQPFNQQAQQSQRSLASNGAQMKIDLYRNNAMTAYQAANFTFDGTVYQPTANMTGFWRPQWEGMTWQYLNGLWGWHAPLMLNYNPPFSII